MKRKVIGLFCILLFAFGCATVNPCAPLLDTPIILENVAVSQEVFQVKIHDTDGDGIGDTMAVYIQKKGSDELVEYFNEPLTEEMVDRVNELVKQKEAREKVNSQ